MRSAFSVCFDPVDATIDLVRVRARRAEHRAAPRKAPPHEVHVERHRAVLDHAPPPVEEADELVVVDRLALAHDGSDHRVQPWAVAATGEQSDSHRVHVTRASRSPVPCRADVGDRRDRCRHDGRARLRDRRRRDAARLVVPRVHAALPRSPDGSSTTRQRSGRSRRRPSPSCRRASTSRSRRSASPTSARPSSCGIGAPAEPLHRAIVWQDRRTAERCDELRDAGHLDLVRSRTGLVLDPYFSATKLEWILRSGAIDPAADVAFGTVDSWLLWNLTGGAVHVTDASNASRTMLYDIGALDWSDELLGLFSVPRSMLPEVRPSSGEMGTTVATARRPRRHPDRGHRRRSAGGALRASVLRGGDDARTPTAPARSC